MPDWLRQGLRYAPLAALVEDGLPLVERPYATWAARLGVPEARVLDTLQRWLAQGTLRRFGVVVRHHELGYTANAANCGGWL